MLSGGLHGSEVKVLFGGTELFDDEVRTTFHSDMRLALISGACIAALVFVLTSFSGTALGARRRTAATKRGAFKTHRTTPHHRTVLLL